MNPLVWTLALVGVLALGVVAGTGCAAATLWGIASTTDVVLRRRSRIRRQHFEMLGAADQAAIRLQDAYLVALQRLHEEATRERARRSLSIPH